MITRTPFRVCVVVGPALAAVIWAAPATRASDDVPAVAESNNAFGLDLYAQLRSTEGNLFFSPFSISSALAMTYAGARGETETQMADVLHFGLPQERLHPAFAGLTQMVTSGAGNGYQLSAANALWAQQDLNLLDEFLRLTEAHYAAGLRRMDFRADAELARQTINRWVEQQTQDKIRDLLARGDVDPGTELVLANAIYFKGNWQSQFDEAATREADFTVAPGRPVQVSMMHQTGEFRTGGAAGARFLELPYKGEDLSMFILLPEAADALADLEGSLTAQTLNTWLSGLRPRQVSVFVPRFEVTTRFDLTTILGAMGMSAAFGRDADFSGMTGQPELFISKVVHKAFVAVDEQGTEAAAATGVGMMRTALPATFRADHPFLFLIRHNGTGAVLFFGRLVDPSSGG